MLLRLKNNRKAALEKAINQVKPEYFFWTSVERENYRVNKPAKDNFAIEQILLQELFNIWVDNEEELSAARNNFDGEQQCLFNSTVLPINGIGENNFFLNEYLAEEANILNFETLNDYCYNDYCFQEKVRREQDPEYRQKPYRGDLASCWARLTVNDVFYYANLSSRAIHIYNALDTTGSNKISELIPHEYVQGKNHGKKEGQGFLYDMNVFADGMELQLEELQDRFWKYLSKRYEELLDQCDQQAKNCVYIIDHSTRNDPHLDFVFSDKTALKAVRFKHFMTDCQQLAGNNQELIAATVQATRAAVDFLEQQYQDITENFDPKIIKLRKKRKIVVATEAAGEFF